MALKPLSVERALSAIGDLEPMPRAVFELEGCIRDPNSGVRDIARVLERDPPLSTRVLKLANSAYYAVPGGVVALEKAVLVLGHSAVHHLALCLQAVGMLNRRGNPPPAWLSRHCQTVAAAARHIAGEWRLAPPEVAYATGLLHDLGRLALWSLFPEELAAYQRELGEAFTESVEREREWLGVDHVWVGEQLAGRYQFPPALKEALVQHHAPAEGGPVLPALVFHAELWAVELEGGGASSQSSPLAARGVPLSPPPELSGEFQELGSG